jgi:hypothetical protein
MPVWRSNANAPGGGVGGLGNSLDQLGDHELLAAAELA